MTGLGAVIDLYKVYKKTYGGGDDKEGQSSEPNLEPEAEESVHGFVDSESPWHHVIQTQEWDALTEMLHHYVVPKQTPKDLGKAKRRLRVVGAAVWVKNKIKPPAPPEEPSESPLLALNEQGHTPLHAAIKNLAPDKCIIRMVLCERKASWVADHDGRLALHWSCLVERNTTVIDRLIRANFHHMQREDKDGKTALCYAIEKAIERKNSMDSETHTNYWGIPRRQEESDWQERQLQTWAKARFILLSYSVRKKIFVRGERNLLVDVLENAGPPELVEVCILAAQGMLKSDPTLASNALRLFLTRHYPIKNLQLLLHHFPEEHVESMATARKLLTNFYHEGCRRHPPRKFTFREEMEKLAVDPRYKRSLLCQEWWNKIKCLLRLCGHQNSKAKKEIFDDNHLLHAALANSDTPPSLVQLLMVMNPDAIKLGHPFNHSLLVHQICRTWKYNLYPHSLKIGIMIDVEEPPMEQILKIVLATDETLTRKRYLSRLPLHDAVSTSKSVEFLDALIRKDERSLSVRDPMTKLYPFQMAALGNLNKNAGLWAHARYTSQAWKTIEPEERARAVDEVIEEKKAEQLSIIFFLLRHFPLAVAPSTSARKAHEFRDAHGKGMISALYLHLVYVCDENGEHTVLQPNLKLLEQAISQKEIPHKLESWWSKVKFWIRYCYKSEIQLQSDHAFLLHAAVANPDVPPQLIELLVAIYPDSVALPINGKTEYPLHIAAGTSAYKAQPYEMKDRRGTIEVLFGAYPNAACVISPRGTPLDIAQAKGTRSQEELVVLRSFHGQNW